MEHDLFEVTKLTEVRRSYNIPVMQSCGRKIVGQVQNKVITYEHFTTNWIEKEIGICRLIWVRGSLKRIEKWREHS